MRQDGGLRLTIRRRLPQFHWTSVESGSSQSGIPDLHGVLDGASLWIECKQTDGWAVRFEQFQVPWLTSYARHGGTCWVAVRRRHAGGPRRGGAVDELWLVAGCHADVLARDGLRGVSTATVQEGGAALWDWPGIARLLCGGQRRRDAVRVAPGR